jgi:hypothetical protein
LPGDLAAGQVGRNQIHLTIERARPDGKLAAPALQGGMRALLIIAIGFLAISSAVAETVRLPASDRSPQTGKVLPLKGTAGANACAAYGPGFVKVEGSGSCVKIGGTLDVGVAASSRR